MHFGSKYVYNYSGSEEECVSDDEFHEGMTKQLSDEEEESKSAVLPPPPPSKSGLFGRLFGGGRGGSASASKSTRFDVDKSAKSKKKSRHHWSSKGRPSEENQNAAVKGRKWRRADTNVINVKFDALKAPSNMHTGDPFHCKGCEAVLSKRSHLKDGIDDIRRWECEFCDVVNDVDLVDEEIPQCEDTTFMLAPAPSTASSGRSGEDDTLIIFCVDTSGSMCVTTEVKGNINLRGSRLDRLQSLNDTRESQYLPHQKRNVTYVSRLQAVQAAVDHQIGEMKKDHKNRRAVLIAFNTEVTVIGDGTGDPVHISGDKLHNKDELIQIGSELGMPNEINKSRDALGNKVFDLEEGGQTALGPALLVSVAMACQVPGSKVIMCTDGMANVGLGSLDSAGDKEAFEIASDFYNEVAQLAIDKGVSVSVTSIKGTDCKMIELGKVADITGGQVNIVDPLKLTEEFGSILADPIIATNVTATLQLHKGLYFRLEESKDSKVTEYVGNVTKESEVTFEYGVRKEFKRKAKPNPLRVSTVMEQDEENVYDNASGKVTKGEAAAPTPENVYDNAAGVSNKGASAAAGVSGGAIDELKELPFQLRITYTDLEGAQALRIITHTMPITHDRNEAEKEMNMATVATHATRKSSKLALQGDYTTGRLNAFMNQRLLHRKATTTHENDDEDVYNCYLSAALPMENMLGLQQSAERSRRGRTYSDSSNSDEDDDFERTDGLSDESKKKKIVAASRPHFQSKGKKKVISRRMQCDDESAHMLYANAQVSSKAFESKKK